MMTRFYTCTWILRIQSWKDKRTCHTLRWELLDIILFIPENNSVRGESIIFVSRVKKLRFTEVKYQLVVVYWLCLDLNFPFDSGIRSFAAKILHKVQVEISSRWVVRTQEVCNKKKKLCNKHLLCTGIDACHTWSLSSYSFRFNWETRLK